MTAALLAVALVAVMAAQAVVLRRRVDRVDGPPAEPMARSRVGRRPSVRLGRAGGGLSALAALAWRVVPAVVGCLVLLVAIDLAVGEAWRALTGPDREVDTVALAAQDLPPARDRRVDEPSMADAPWADRYFAEMEAVDWEYVPYIGPREAPVRGRYLTSVDGVRRSYEPAVGPGEDAVTVWFFGGSSLWGEGQRDLHTIPSEVARLAEDDGVALRVSNFGVRGYTAFQEYLVFEQELGRREPPDLAVFYHGFNELSTQTEAPENLGDQPTIFQLAVTSQAFERAPVLPRVAPTAEPSVGRDYLDTAVVPRLLRGAGNLLSIPPAAADEPFYRPPPAEMRQAIDNAEAIYRRTLPLIEHEAAAHDVRPVIFWQPAAPEPNLDELGERVAGLGIDISDALDDAPPTVFLDGVHTNELGARFSAEAIWTHLAPRVAEVDPS